MFQTKIQFISVECFQNISKTTFWHVEGVEDHGEGGGTPLQRDLVTEGKAEEQGGEGGEQGGGEGVEQGGGEVGEHGDGEGGERSGKVSEEGGGEGGQEQ